MGSTHLIVVAYAVSTTSNWPEFEGKARQLILSSEALDRFIDKQSFFDQLKKGSIDSNLHWRVFSLAFAADNATRLRASTLPSSDGIAIKPIDPCNHPVRT